MPAPRSRRRAFPPTSSPTPRRSRQFEQNQATLSGALSRLMVVTENYPNLKADQNFLTLQAQLEGTENRIAVARRDYILAVQQYDTELTTIPGRWYHSMFYGSYQPIQNFSDLGAGPAGAQGEVLV